MIPLEAQYWSYKEIGEALRISVSTVQQHIACHPTFPKPKRPPTVRGQMHPRYKATDVLEWIEREGATAY